MYWFFYTIYWHTWIITKCDISLLQQLIQTIQIYLTCSMKWTQTMPTSQPQANWINVAAQNWQHPTTTQSSPTTTPFAASCISWACTQTYNVDFLARERRHDATANLNTKVYSWIKHTHRFTYNLHPHKTSKAKWRSLDT